MSLPLTEVTAACVEATRSPGPDIGDEHPVAMQAASPRKRAMRIPGDKSNARALDASRLFAPSGRRSLAVHREIAPGREL